MSNAVVFVFLLDNLSGLNRTLNSTLLRSQNNIVLQQCNSKISSEILTKISEQFHVKFQQKWRKDLETRPRYDIFKLMSDNKLQNLHTIFENTVESVDIGSYDTAMNIHEYNDESDCAEDILGKSDDLNASEVTFPKSAPFLVAIFETLSNVTAQTCAGTLISPRWVLTASNCINLLVDLYANGSSTLHSRYTIVAGSNNPLSEGTVHNVTSIKLHPDPADKIVVAGSAKAPILALMKIDPELPGMAIGLASGEVKVTDVMVYGWVLSKNGSGHDILNFTTMSVTILSPAECKTMYSYRNNEVLCLYNKDMEKNITLMSTGGPILAVVGGQLKMLAVAQTDEHLFVAYSLYDHFKWIKKIINQ